MKALAQSFSSQSMNLQQQQQHQPAFNNIRLKKFSQYFSQYLHLPILFPNTFPNTYENFPKGDIFMPIRIENIFPDLFPLLKNLSRTVPQLWRPILGIHSVSCVCSLCGKDLCLENALNFHILWSVAWSTSENVKIPWVFTRTQVTCTAWCYVNCEVKRDIHHALINLI